MSKVYIRRLRRQLVNIMGTPLLTPIPNYRIIELEGVVIDDIELPTGNRRHWSHTPKYTNVRI